MKKFIKRIIRPTEYKLPDGKTVTITPDRIQHWIDQFEKMQATGLNVPAPYHHGDKDSPPLAPVRSRANLNDSDASKNAGFWNRLFIADDGWLMGELEAATDADAQAIGNKVKGVSLLAPEKWIEDNTTWNDAITHICLTNKPVAVARDNFVALSLSADMAVEDKDGGTIPAGDAVSLATALEILAKLGLALPDGTNEANFLDRLVTAGTAVLSHKETQEGADELTKKPPGAKEAKPAPIAMSADYSFAVSALNASGSKDPQGNPWTVETLAEASKPKVEEVQFSADVQARLKMADEYGRALYRERLAKAVTEGKLTVRDAQDFVEPALASGAVQFSADGVPTISEADRLLKMIEARPKGSCLGGLSRAELQKQAAAGNFGAKFSAIREATPPPVPQDVQNMSQEEAVRIADEALAMAGVTH